MARRKPKWIIDPVTKKRKLDKRTPYAALKDDYASVDADRAALADQVIALRDQCREAESELAAASAKIATLNHDALNARRVARLHEERIAQQKIDLAAKDAEIIKLRNKAQDKVDYDHYKPIYATVVTVDIGKDDMTAIATARVFDGAVHVVSVRDVPSIYGPDALELDLRGAGLEGTIKVRGKGVNRNRDDIFRRLREHLTLPIKIG